METRTILVCGAGGGGSNNLIRSIRRSGINVRIIGSNLNKFFAAKSIADKTYILPEARSHLEHITKEEKNEKTNRYVGELNKLIKREKIGLVIPNSDREVFVISKYANQIDAKIFLPPHDIVALCQDKFLLTEKMRANRIPMAESYCVESYESIERIFQKLRNPQRVWCRLRTGSGSKGAAPMGSAEQAKFWISYWETMRGIPHRNFIISRMLPGRDYAFQSTWKDGKLVLGKICERLEYYGGENRASGTSSTPQLGKTVLNSEVIDICSKAVKVIDPKATGNYNFDLKEDEQGVPNICEINIGRFCMITPIFDLTGRHNMAETYIRLAFNEKIEIEDPVDIEENVYLVRFLDTEPLIIREEEIEKLINYP